MDAISPLSSRNGSHPSNPFLSLIQDQSRSFFILLLSFKMCVSQPRNPITYDDFDIVTDMSHAESLLVIVTHHILQIPGRVS